MAATDFVGEPKFQAGSGASGSSSSIIREWRRPNEFWRRFTSQIGTNSDRVPSVVNDNPMYPVTLTGQVQEHSRVPPAFLSLFLQESMRMESSPCLSSPLFCSLPRTIVQPLTDAHGFLHHFPGTNQEDPTLQLMPGSSSSSSSHTTSLEFSNPCGFYFPQRRKGICVGSEDENGCDLELRLSTSRWTEGQSVSDVQTSLPTKLLVGQEAEGGGHRDKKARTDSRGAAFRSSSCEEIDQELGLSL